MSTAVTLSQSIAELHGYRVGMTVTGAVRRRHRHIDRQTDRQNDITRTEYRKKQIVHAASNERPLPPTVLLDLVCEAASRYGWASVIEAAVHRCR